MILQTFSMCFVYNSKLTFTILEKETKKLDKFLKTWLTNLKLFNQTYEIRQSIYGLSIILKNDLLTAPKLFQQSLPQIMDCIIFLLQKHIEAKEQNLVLNQEAKEDDFGDADEFKKNI